MTGIEITSNVEERLVQQLEELKRNIAKGLIHCQLLLKREAQKITPWDTGNLAGSYSTPPPSTENDIATATVENSAEYALWVHEMPESRNWNKPGTGPKFLERPLFENEAKFLEILKNATSL